MRFRFPRGVRVAVLLAVAALMAVPLAVAGSASQITGPTMSSDLWFVELSGNPTADGGSKAAVQAEKKAFRDAAKAAGVSYKERFAFDDLWNGLSVQTGSSNLEKLSELKGVKAVYPVETIPMPETTQLSDPELATALAMTGADNAQSELGFDGTGVKVAVMDTGVDYDHADLGGDGVQRANSNVFPTARVVAGQDLVGDAFNANPADPAYNPTTTPDAFPDDCNSHGTHVAGIVGANGAVDGVAPGVTFGAYRVFGCGGSTTADIMIAAMEAADADGMDVLNMSIGSAFNTWAQYPTAAASDALVNKGVVVVASIGNSGADGVYSAGAPGVGNRVIGVASYDNTHVNLNSFTISPDDTRIGYANAAAAPPAPLSGSLPMTLAVAGSPPSGAPIEGCGPVPVGTYAGKAVLVRRGTCTFHVKAVNAQNGGAAAVVLYNNVPGRISPTVAGPTTITIPVVAISDTEGALINGRLTSGPVTMTWTTQAFTSPNLTGGTISSFSSFGLGAELALKPDIGAPGGLIRSTFPIELGSYATISGTSMSSPHVAGAVALLLEANPNVGTKQVRDILQNSADPKVKFNTTDLDATHRQGAGMLDIDDAILATTRVEPGKLSLGEGSGGTETLNVTNTGGSAVTYDLSHQPALGTTNTFAPVNHSTAFSTVGFSSPNVTVPAGGSASVDVTITPNASLPDKSVYGGYITFTPQGGGQTFRVPYAGFKGDYQSIQILTPSPSATFNPPNQLPWLARLTACPGANGLGILRGSECFGGGTVTRQSAGAVFTFQPGLNQTPFVVAHFDHQVRSFEANLYSASNNKKVGEAFDLDYLGRNSTAGGIFAFIWGGQVSKKNGNKPENAVDGSYYLQVTATKALGDPSNAETWTSPTFVIDRP